MTTDFAALAALHEAAFAAGPPRPWSAAELEASARAPGAALRVSGDPPEGFALARAAAGEAELLTIAVAPGAQGRGLGARLLAEIETAAAGLGARRLILDVAETNAAARRLYARAGYAQVGRRRHYFDGVDALVLAKEIPPQSRFAPP